MKIIVALLLLVCVQTTQAKDPIHAKGGEKPRGENPIEPRVTSARGLEFIANRGQVEDQFHRPMPQVLYTTSSHGVRVDLTRTGMYYTFSRVLHDSRERDSVVGSDLLRDPLKTHENDSVLFYRVDMEFEGTNPNAHVEELEEAPDYTNYYLAHCPNGILHVPVYRKLIYHDLYPGIDMMIYSTEDSVGQDRMKYDCLVHPGARPELIRMRYDAADSVQLRKDGVSISTVLGNITEESPYSYQSSGTVIPSRFDLEKNTISFFVGEYDRTQTIVIDPPRLWGTYFGGSGREGQQGLTTDKDDNVIVCGGTQSASAIASPGSFQSSLIGNIDAYVAKFGPDGTRKWATYYGAGGENGYAVATDRAGSIIMVGTAASSSGIATPGAYQTVRASTKDGMIVKFDSSGQRLWGTYYGGPDATTTLVAVAVDSASSIRVAGQSAVTGVTTSGTFIPSLPLNAQASVVAKFSGSGYLVWGTFIGSKTTAWLGSLAVDLDGNTLVCAQTNDSSLATAGTFRSTYFGNPSIVLCLDTTGNRIWGSYVGDDYDNRTTTQAWSIACDRHNRAVVTGSTTAFTLATPNAYLASMPAGVGHSAFLVSLDNSGKGYGVPTSVETIPPNPLL